MVCPKNPKNKMQKTITNCPTSIPNANSKIDKRVLSLELTRDSNALANPNPWMNPKNKTKLNRITGLPYLEDLPAVNTL